jgi:hypothetical protein
MSKKQQVQVTVFNGSQYESDGWPPEDPAGFMAWFQERIERIPPEHRATAKIEIGTQSGYYGDSTANLEITYARDETDEQFAARLQREENDRQRRVAQEKQTLAALQAKYGAL